MLRLLHAALMAASLQLIAIIIFTPCVLLFAPHSMNCSNTQPTIRACESFWNSVSLFLICAYLLIAVGLALTRNQSIEITANRIRTALSIASPARERTLMLLVIQPIIGATALAIVALQPPPDFLLWAVGHFGPASAAAIVWGAAMSVGVAGSGAVAHAALRALDNR
jgi:hypothetical protein